jgi:hypothetical protein
MGNSKQKTFRLSGADKVSFIILDHQDKETDHGIIVSREDDEKYIRSFVRRGFLRRHKSTWKFTRIGNIILQKVRREFN